MYMSLRMLVGQKGGANGTRREREANRDEVRSTSVGCSGHERTKATTTILCGLIGCIQYQYKNQMVVS